MMKEMYLLKNYFLIFTYSDGNIHNIEVESDSNAEWSLKDEILDYLIDVSNDDFHLKSED